MTHTTLPLSRELYKAGLKIETEKWWCIYHKNQQTWEYDYRIQTDKTLISGLFCSPDYKNIDMYYPAYSTDELLAVIPRLITKKDTGRTAKCFLAITTYPNFTIKYLLEGDHIIEDVTNIKISDKSLPEALGKMCLWLLSNGYHFNGKELER